MQIFISINDILPAAALLFILACFAGVPVLSLLSYLTGIAQKKVFMFKLARQMARLGLLFIVSMSLACAGVLGASYYYGPEADTWLEHHVFWESGIYLCLVALFFFRFFWPGLELAGPFEMAALAGGRCRRGGQHAFCRSTFVGCMEGT